MKAAPLFAIALLSLAPAAGAAIAPYSNNFSGTGSNTAFSTESADADWALNSGAYRFTYSSTIVGPSVASIPITNVAGNSFTVQTSFTLNSLGTVNANGQQVGFGVLGASNTFGGSNAASAYYLADWVVNSSGTPGQLRVLALGDTTGFTSTNVSVDANPTSSSQAAVVGDTYVLKLEGNYVGSTLKLSLGVFDTLGVQFGASATATDTSPLTGSNFGYRNRIGIGGGTFSADFDDFTVGIPEPSTGALLLAAGALLLGRRRRTA